MLAKVTSGVLQYFVSDRLSARIVLDASGSVSGRMAHLPFGEHFGQSGVQEKHLFTTYERDAESGLDYALNRSYGLNLGRFLQADPYRASGHVIDPRSWNRYSYARNNATNAVDPLGLADKPFGLSDLAAWAEFMAGGVSWPGVSVNAGLRGVAVGSGGGSTADQFYTADDEPDESGGFDQQAIEEFLKALQGVIEASAREALDLLRNRQECRDFLKGSDGQSATTKLEELIKANKIKPGPGSFVDTTGKKVPYEGVWMNGQILIAPAFFTYKSYRMEGNIKITAEQRRMFLILHELGHATGAKVADHYQATEIDWKKLNAYQKGIAENCFK